MKKICESRIAIELEMQKSLLEQAEISCQIQHAALTTLAGAVPFDQCYASLWVLNDADVARAEAILAASQEVGEVWICPRCGESVDAELAVCWNCGAVAPP